MIHRLRAAVLEDKNEAVQLGRMKIIREQALERIKENSRVIS